MVTILVPFHGELWTEDDLAAFAADLALHTATEDPAACDLADAPDPIEPAEFPSYEPGWIELGYSHPSDMFFDFDDDEPPMVVYVGR